MENKGCFDSALYGVSENIRQILKKVSKTVKANAEEIRLRKDMPIALTVSGETVFIRENGEISFSLCDDLYIANETDLEESFYNLCSGSVYAHGEELKNGFVIMKNGCRAGACGTLSGENMKDITSLNIRISRQILGAANDILKKYSSGGLLIAGAPGSGKTTVLRDLIRQLSSGETGRYKRVCVIDSRGEISGGGTLDLGFNTDVLNISDKALGIEIAVRTMFPDIVAFDEIGTAEELKNVSESFHSGVEVITTAHIGEIDELLTRRVTSQLIKSGAISKIAVLPKLHGGDIKVIDKKELNLACVV